MSAAFWVSSAWVVGESAGGWSWGTGVNVLDGGGLFSDFVACCRFLSYSSRFIRKEREFVPVDINTNESFGAGSFCPPVVSFRHLGGWGRR